MLRLYHAGESLSNRRAFHIGKPAGRRVRGLRNQRIILLVVLVGLLALAWIRILAAMFGIFSRFGKIAVASFDAYVLGAMSKLSFE